MLCKERKIQYTVPNTYSSALANFHIYFHTHTHTQLLLSQVLSLHYEKRDNERD